MNAIALSRRLRRTPFSPGVEASGVKSYTVYNRMLLPAVFESLEADYHHLKQHVQVWDVSVERQIELTGPDASYLMQLLTPRDLSRMQADQCCYVPIVDETGGMLNDPVALKIDDNRWWVSIADSDLLFWIKGISVGMGLNVKVREPDVSPLAIQGPLAEELMSRVFGETVNDIRFFRYKWLPFMGSNMLVARSGYSKQGGFEIYLEDSGKAMPLWNELFKAGTDLNVRAGCPNSIERIEGGLLSYGNDMNMENTPMECGLTKFCDFPENTKFIGKEALQSEKATGPKRQIRPIEIQGKAVPLIKEAWPLLHGDRKVGQVTSAAWSPDFQVNVAIGMVDEEYWEVGTELELQMPDELRSAIVQQKFWI